MPSPHKVSVQSTRKAACPYVHVRRLLLTGSSDDNSESLDSEEFLEALVRLGAAFATTSPFSAGVECASANTPHITQALSALLAHMNMAARVVVPGMTFKVK